MIETEKSFVGADNIEIPMRGRVTGTLYSQTIKYLFFPHAFKKKQDNKNT